MIDFSEFPISPAAAQLIEAAVRADRLPHAVILEGGSENDRLTLARRLAQALLCRGEDRPCGACSDCRKALHGVHPDLTECLAQPGDADSLKVDAIRQIRADAFIFPNESDRRVFLLHNMQLSSEAAQNALLKILEEPPEYVRFLLTCPSASALLPTILSRACVYSLGQQVETRSDEANKAIAELTRLLALALCAPNEYERFGKGLFADAAGSDAAEAFVPRRSCAQKRRARPAPARRRSRRGRRARAPLHRPAAS